VITVAAVSAVVATRPDLVGGVAPPRAESVPVPAG
jgi:hypothetical protein